MPPELKRRATIDVLASHWARLTPFVPEVQEQLLRREFAFSTGGPLGHAVRAKYSDSLVEECYFYRFDAGTGAPRRLTGQKMPQGMVPQVVEWVAELGYEVKVRDCRTDSPRWVLAGDWKRRVPKGPRGVVEAVGRERALRVVARDLDSVADAVAGVADAYPEAMIAVAVATHKQLGSIRRRLQSRVEGEKLGLYTAKRRCPGRVSVGLIGQLPRGTKGETDLLVLPFAESTVSDAALRVVTSGRYRRVLSFTPSRWTPDENVNRRLLVVAGAVFPPPKAAVPVTAIVLDTHGTRPAGKFAGPLDAKKKLYWRNDRRNRRVAEAAKRLARATKKSVASLVGAGDAGLLNTVVGAAGAGVAVLVETPAHARELAALLPGWAVLKEATVDEHQVPKPQPGCGVIATELGAAETVLSAGVLVRATGTRWPLPDVDWPWVGDVDHGVLIDFRDDYHPAAARNASHRTQGYRDAGMAVRGVGRGRAAGR